MYITQSTQDYPAAVVPLVKDRSAWVRVFVRANPPGAAAPKVRVALSGCASNPPDINPPQPTVPVADPENASSSWNAAIPASCIQPGVQMTATVDPTNAIAESDETNNALTRGLDVHTLTQWKVTLLPVHTGDGRTGNVNQAPRLATDWVEFAKRLHPVPDNVDVVVAPTWNTSNPVVNTLTSNGGGWDTVLNEIQTKRAMDGAAANQRYYYGVVNVGYGGGVAGLGFIGFPAAIGWDKAGFDAVLAHEVGHNFNREHSPGCDAGSPDPSYPYPSSNGLNGYGFIGVTGWDAFASSGNLKSMSVYNDIMNYCNTQWISDYVYKSILSFRQAQGFDVAAAAAPASGEGLLVWGRIEDGKTILEPAFRVAATGIKPASGPYKWEAQDALGNALASMSFDAPRVADLPGGPVQMFAFVVPMSTQALDAVRSLRIMKDGQELTRTLPRAQFAGEPAPTAPAYLGGHRAQLTWNANRYPMAMIRDARTGEVRGFLQGGTATVVDAPDDMEVQYSDGVRVTKFRYQSPAQ
jgi:hypothetical protein